MKIQDLGQVLCELEYKGALYVHEKGLVWMHGTEEEKKLLFSFKMIIEHLLSEHNEALANQLIEAQRSFLVNTSKKILQNLEAQKAVNSKK